MTGILPTVEVVCVFADRNGMSRLADVELPALAETIDENGKTRFVGTTRATVMGFVVGATSAEKDWHVADMAGLSIVLSGEWEIEAGSGDRRTLKTGAVLLMLDTDGQGHRSRTYLDTGCTVLGVGIDDATQISYSGLVAHLV